ncbi:MAG: T9SS type A sorting domain-containing protein [Chitinophagales bacterium]|nr:T9SS type A sorting domain-containing protein [Chitinophagales bacterium]
MKRSLTFLFMIFSLILMAQNGKITVHVEDGCQNYFEEPVHLELYNYTVDSSQIVATSTSNPTTFTGLNPNDVYAVKVSSSARHKKHVSIKDIYTAQAYIYDYYKENIATRLAGDVNKNGDLTTLDLVLLQRHMIGLIDIVSDEWFFVDFNTSMENLSTVLEFEDGNAEIIFSAFKYGAVESTLTHSCFCEEDPTGFVKLSIPALEVNAGQQVSFDLIYNGDIQDIGMKFSLNYEDGHVNGVTLGNSVTIANPKYDKKELNFVTNFINFPFNPNKQFINFKVATISFVPERSGSLLSFFKINDNFDNEFVYKDFIQTGSPCLKTYKTILLQDHSICDIYWPKDITIPTCSDQYYTGEPHVDSECSMYFSYTDERFGSDPCDYIHRNWNAINWVKGEKFNHIQIITVDKNHPIACYDTTVVVNSNGQAIIHAADLIFKIPFNRQAYSFSSDNPADTIRVLDINNPPLTQYFTVYSLADSTACIASVTTILNADCTDPVHVIDEITIQSSLEDFKIEGKLFDGGNEMHCLGNISDFQIKSPFSNVFRSIEIFDFFAYRGNSFYFELGYNINGVFHVHGLVKVNLVDENSLHPFELTCYDDQLTKGVEHDIAIFSPTFEHIYAIQGAFNFTDAQLIRTRKVSLDNIDLTPRLNNMLFLWVDGNPVTLSDTDTIFVMTIMPSADHTVSEILSLDDNVLSAEVILDQFQHYKKRLEIKFLKRTSTSNSTLYKDVPLYPNPTTGDFTIENSDIHEGTISIFNEVGQAVYTTVHKSVNGVYNVSIPEHIQAGIYIVRLQNQQYVSVKKLILMK